MPPKKTTEAPEAPEATKKAKATKKTKSKKPVVKGSWIWCVGEARKNLEIEGFVAITNGSKLYKEAMRLKELHTKKS